MPIDPPTIQRSPDLRSQLEAAYAAKGPDYAPRTHLKGTDGRARYVNRLILEPSPYLIQHAHNPVDWHPWGAEALQRARDEDKPIFLSVGYATCHWCHVMEEESFDEAEVAALLNAHFIPVKLDREQRPDLDQIYITATQLQQGHAGWPNSIWLLPDGRPFHTGTYFPKPQFMGILQAIANAWAMPGQRPEIEQVATQIATAIQRQQAARLIKTPPPGPEQFNTAVAQLVEMQNEAEGGFSQSKQFPQEGFILFLLDQWRRIGDETALSVAVAALDAIAHGGIHDHLGGGFHRYTVDPNWRTPHFEKMLYNQGQLARAFVEGWEATGNPVYARAAKRAFAYIARDMTDPEGAFYSAEDADSLDPHGALEEGAFYVIAPSLAHEVLPGEAKFVIETLGLAEPPTIKAGPVVHLRPGAEIDYHRLDPMLEALRLARDRRPRPLRDDKIIAGWNGLMIRALAEGAVAFGAPDYAQMAAKAGETLWSRLWSGHHLHRLWAGGAALEDGMLEDYVWLGLGFAALFEATGVVVWRARAAMLAKAMLAQFDDGAGRLKMAAKDGPIGPVYESSDGATPAGESSAIEFLIRTARLTQEAELRIRAEELRATISAPMTEVPLLRPDAITGSRILDDGASTLRRVLADGTVTAHLTLAGELRLKVADGWHLNAAEPGPDWLSGARVEGAEVQWPKGDAVTLGFSRETIRIYQGELRLALTGISGPVTLHVQTCSDALCLEPISVTFRLPSAS
ncbi:MAG: DUF255 domain-containing protein [Pseudomonadota bacterium]